MTEVSFVRLRKAAAMLGVGVATLHRWDRQDILGITKLGPRVMGYPRAELEAFIQGRKNRKEGK
jgi:predicted DNA-binding transcriptional regulator AlpA